MVRKVLASMVLAASSFSLANRVMETTVDGFPVCYEDHPSRTVVVYIEGEYATFVLDANKSGALDSPLDRVVTFTDDERLEYYLGGIVETELFERPDGSFNLGSQIYLGSIIVGGEKVFDTKMDREAYDAARLRFTLESERLEDSLSEARILPLVSCDLYGVFGIPPSAGRQ